VRERPGLQRGGWDRRRHASGAVMVFSTRMDRAEKLSITSPSERETTTRLPGKAGDTVLTVRTGTHSDVPEPERAPKHPEFVFSHAAIRSQQAGR
jgi:hypothetical protein